MTEISEKEDILFSPIKQKCFSARKPNLYYSGITNVFVVHSGLKRKKIGGA